MHVMKIRKTHLSWAVRLWILGAVFVLPFLAPWEIAAWVAVLGVLGWGWKVLPEEPEKPVEPLPYQHLYAHTLDPRRDAE
jgi:hypothetical protein